jgi:hypothetical protein
MTRYYILAGAVLVVLGVWYFWDQLNFAASYVSETVSPSDPPSEPTEMILTSTNSDGTVCVGGEPADPSALAASAGMDLDTYALARMVESETANLRSLEASTAVAAAALNYANGRSIAGILLRATKRGNGYFGKQDQGRYAASSKDPGPLAISAALAAQAGQDPTNGADQWDSPWSYATPARADEVAATRTSAGKSKFVLPGVPERKLRFWRYS